MIGLDTNVLVRYLADDDPEQSGRAAALIEGAADRGEALYLSGVVLCEVVWVLRGPYKRGREEIAGALDLVLRSAAFVIEDLDLTRRAWERYAAGGADFADYLIAEKSLSAGCDRVATFDRKLLRERGFAEP
ncbi:MAG: type II toxin-antitoxin system VapC family toxin [Myxococcales bacterium]|nr:type II toxin-antitoxin system VapC family toxin [Myxococcales bacterium]